jgi:hypothetical protein
LCFQIENLPSLIRLVWESQILDSKELLELIKKQIKDESDLITILKKEKKITDAKIVELELLQMSKKIPLGEALVKLNFTNIDIINNALKDFYDNKFHLEVETKNTPKIEKQEVEISDAALESLRELGMTLEIEPTGAKVTNTFNAKPFVDQYLDLFTEKFKNKVKKLIQIIGNEVASESDISNYFNSLFRDLHILKGTIILSELNTMEEFVTIWENKIEKVLTKSNDEIRSWCKKNLPLLDNGIDLLWQARIIISKDKTDEGLIQDENFINDLNSILDKIT